MVIYDIHGNVLINPDLSTGVVERGFKNVDDNYEEVGYYHEYTPEELETIAAQQEKKETLDWLYVYAKEDFEMTEDAIAEMSETVSENNIDISDLSDAFAELSEIISDMLLVTN